MDQQRLSYLKFIEFTFFYQKFAQEKVVAKKLNFQVYLAFLQGNELHKTRNYSVINSLILQQKLNSILGCCLELLKFARTLICTKNEKCIQW